MQEASTPNKSRVNEINDHTTLFTFTFTIDPFSPFNCFRTSVLLILIPAIFSPSTAIIRFPANKPTFFLMVPLATTSTTSNVSLTLNWIPIPRKAPRPAVHSPPHLFFEYTGMRVPISQYLHDGIFCQFLQVQRYPRKRHQSFALIAGTNRLFLHLTGFPLRVSIFPAPNRRLAMQPPIVILFSYFIIYFMFFLFYV